SKWARGASSLRPDGASASRRCTTRSARSARAASQSSRPSKGARPGGGGVSCALACDMLVMARDAYFSVAYVKAGLSPDGGTTAFLSKLVSRQLLTALCLTGDRIGAERLGAMGAG